MTNRNYEILTNASALFKICYNHMPKRWQLHRMGRILKSEHGYYLQVDNRRLYTSTPEFILFLQAIQVAVARQVQALLKEIV